MEEGNSIRDQMKDEIREFMAQHYHIGSSEVDYDMVCDLTDVIFAVLYIDENTQDTSYKEYVERRNFIQKQLQVHVDNKNLDFIYMDVETVDIHDFIRKKEKCEEGGEENGR
jgi:hypothetical protein